MAIFCPHCGAETDENDRFCIVCGELVHGTATCNSCGEVVPIAAAFCPKCGVSFLDHPELCVQRVYATEESDFADGTDEAIEDDEENWGQDEGGFLSLIPWRRRHSSLPPHDVQENFDEEDEAPSDEDGDSSCEVGVLKKFSLRGARKKKKNRRASKCVEPDEPIGKDTMLDSDSVPTADDLPGIAPDNNATDTDTPEREREEPADRTPLMQRESRKSEKRHAIGFVSLLIAKFGKNRVSEGVSMQDSEDEPIEEPVKEGASSEFVSEEDTPDAVLRVKEKRKLRKRKAKANEEEQAAMVAFETTANADGYYNDVRPADYGEDDEEQPDYDIKQIIAVVAIIAVACAIIVKLQSLL